MSREKGTWWDVIYPQKAKRGGKRSRVERRASCLELFAGRVLWWGADGSLE